MEEEPKTLLRTLIYKPRDEAIQRLTKMRDEAFESTLGFYEEVLRGIEPKYHRQFIMFAEKGEASPEFLAYIGHNEQAQQVCDMVFEAQVNLPHNLSRAMLKGCLERLAQEEAEALRVRGRKK